ncbi:MAG: citrate transporter [Candidatus Margulisiibacteriota bacterium]|jgi:hypothetical protein
MFTGILLLIIFLALAFLMYLGKIPALLALPVLAILLAFVAGVPFYLQQAGVEGSLLAKLRYAFSEAFKLSFITVVSDGVPRLQMAIFTVILGGIFGQLLKITGVGEALVRKAAELAGDNPLSLCLIMTLVVSFLFTTLSGLGSVILVANIFFPLLLSVGIPPLLTGCIFLIGFSLGGVFNIVNWALYIDVLGMQQAEVMRYAIPFGGLFLLLLIAFIVIEFKRAKLPVPLMSLLKIVGGMALIGGLLAWLKIGNVLSADTYLILKNIYKISIFTFLFLPLFGKRFFWVPMLAPFLPISLVLILNWAIIPSFLIGIIYLFITTLNLKQADAFGTGSKMVVQSAIEGIQGVTPAIAIMLGIGMVLISVNQEPVKQCLTPLLSAVLPSSPLGYVIFFTVMAPLALYRGPLNLWGMGSGLMGLIKQTALLGNVPIMAAFMATGQIQGVCDPTNTHNVWIANQLKIDLNAILTKTLPYIWVITLLGLILGVYVS